MLEVDMGEAKRAKISNRLGVLKKQQDENPELYSVVDWRAEHTGERNLVVNVIAVGK